MPTNPTTRTPTEIFEEVLDNYVPSLLEAAYRDEFQAALVRLVDDVAVPAESTASAEEAFGGPAESDDGYGLLEALKASLAQDRRFRGGELAGDD